MWADTTLDAERDCSLSNLLGTAADSFEGLGSTGNALQKALRGLNERLTEGRFHLAVLGQVKRGKSTFINAMLGAPLLPTAVVPLTALPTFIRWGSQAEAKVSFLDGRLAETGPCLPGETLQAFLERFVTEAGNPRNRKGVRQVDVRFPSPLLEAGLVIIDTPGIGSTLTHNTEATLQFLPQCDAALFMVSPDPPMTEVEVLFLRKVQAKMTRILFILNKVDYLDLAERKVLLAFIQDLLAEHLGFPAGTAIHEVSARRGLQAILQGDPAGWQASGLGQVMERLQAFMRREKTPVLEASVAGKAAGILDEALLFIQLTVQSLKMPIQDLEARLAQFEEALEAIRHERVLAADLLAGDRRRAHALLEEMAEALRQKAHAILMKRVRTELDQQARPTEEAIQVMLATMVPGFFEQELEVISARFTTRTEQMLTAHQARSDQLLDQLRKTAADLFEVRYRAPQGTGAFKLNRDPYWVSRQWTDSLSPINPAWVDRLLPAAARKRRLLARVGAQVDLLVIRNVENLRWSLYQSLDETLRRFSANLDERLAATLQVTREGMVLALEKRKDQASSIQEDVIRLGGMATQLGQLQSTLRVHGSHRIMEALFPVT